MCVSAVASSSAVLVNGMCTLSVLVRYLLHWRSRMASGCNLYLFVLPSVAKRLLNSRRESPVATK